MSDFGLPKFLPASCAHCGFFHSSAVCPPNLSGRALYEADLKDRPSYHDGAPRKTWEQLSDVARWSWERDNALPVASNVEPADNSSTVGTKT